jgi:hypothetical protein
MPITQMKKILPNIKLALILTPAIFLLALWILALSSSGIVATMGIFKLTLWALLLSFGAALSIAMFVSEILNQRKQDE